ncbi:hypothetical protein YC2023_052247 [Brassica napus]
MEITSCRSVSLDQLMRNMFLQSGCTMLQEYEDKHALINGDVVGYHATVKEEIMGQLRLEQMDIPYENCMSNHLEPLMLDQSGGGGDQNLEPEMIQETA